MRVQRLRYAGVRYQVSGTGIGGLGLLKVEGPEGALSLGTCVGVAKGSRRVVTDAMGSSAKSFIIYLSRTCTIITISHILRT